MNQDSFKVGTFNVYNLTTPDIPYYERRYTTDQYKQKIAWIASQLQRMDADIIGFQEVFLAEALKNALAASGRYNNAQLYVAGGTGEGPSLGFVSRFPILTQEVIRDFPKKAQLDIDRMLVPVTYFSRPIIKARVEIHSRLKVTFFVAHLKSKRPLVKEGANPHDPMERTLGKARSLITRAAEATALRHLLLEEIHGTNQPVVVMGDLNDGGEAVTSELICGSPPWRTLPREAKERIWDTLLYNVKDIQVRRSYRDVYFSHVHNGRPESLDHILVSQEFVRENPNRLGEVEYVSNFNDHLVDDTTSDEHVPVWQSDHGQVVVTIRIRDEQRY
jgi:predicted extracellular nuclease